MPDNFSAEKVSSADQIFATDQRASDSAHFPIGKLAHGALNTFTLTTTSDPFPVKLFGNDSTAPVHFTTDSGAPPKILIDNDSATAIHVRGLTDSHVAITSDSGNPVFVRGLTNSIVDVLVTNTNVTVTGYTSSITQIGSTIQAGALQTFTTVLSSAIESATTSAARLYGWYVTNPDTASFVYLKIFDDDSAGVTKGTTAAHINLGIPPSGGANVFTPQGMAMSSGISMLAAGGTATTDTSAPATSLIVNLYFAG